MRTTRLRGLLALTVLLHLALSLLHGRAHTGAEIELSAPALLFVVTVVLAAPPLGLAIGLRSPRGGAWLVSAALACSFVFGAINHFGIAGPDRVDHVNGAWRTIFAASAIGLAAVEAVGSALAATCAMRVEKGLRQTLRR
jgi:hypothetical protein